MKKSASKINARNPAGLTLKQYAKAKQLEISFLKKLGLSDMQLGDKSAVGIPYKNVDSVEQAMRIRVGLTGARFRWAKGSKPCLYGLWRLEKMSAKHYIVVVEGESDTHTLWLHGIPAVGLPGANSFQESWAADIAGIPTIYIIIEPDRGGDAVLKRLTKSGIRQRVKLVRLDGAKDPSELYLKDPKHFKKNFRAALKAAVPWSESQQPEEKNDDDAGDSAVRPSQASQLIAIADSAQFFRSTDDKPYATIPVNGHHENWPLQSVGFKHWWSHMFYKSERTAPCAQALHDALGVITGRALYEGDQQEVFTRVGQAGGHLYLDLGDADWRAIEIDPSGWKVVKEPPVRFRRARAMASLPEPARGGTIEELWPFINVGPMYNKILVASWLAAAFRPRGPFPVLALNGEQGTGKSTTDRVLRSLVDPSTANMRSFPGGIRDLMITARNSHVIALDNLSHLPDWLSDALCRLATGGGFSTRELYSDDEEVVFNAMRPILLNGIGEVVTRADLMERTVMISLPAIPKNKRLPEAEFWRSFDLARPRILGVLLDAVTSALGEIESVKLNELPRMADFAKWSTAAEEAFGFMPGSFQLAYESNLEDAHAVVLDSSPVASLLRKFLERDEHSRWVGTASELLEILGNLRSSGDSGHGFPKSANGLAGALRRLAPNLRATGIVIGFARKPGTGERLIKIDVKS